MLVEACHTTILIIIPVAHSKKSKGFFRSKTTGDPWRFPEELRHMIVSHDGILQTSNTKGFYIKT